MKTVRIVDGEGRKVGLGNEKRDDQEGSQGRLVEGHSLGITDTDAPTKTLLSACCRGPYRIKPKPEIIVRNEA